MTGPQYNPGPNPEGQDPGRGQAPQYGDSGFPPPPPPQYGGSPEQGIHSTAGEPAGAGMRVLARIVDGLIVGIPVGIVEFVARIAGGAAVGYIVGLVLSLAGFVYFVMLESRGGATLGKRMLSLRTVGPDGGLPSQQVAMRRNAFMLLGVVSALLNFAGLLSGLVTLIWLGVMIALGVTIANDPNKQGFHDKFAGGTRVVRA
jgi:uncharacterized RDD family membrane protein YckC